MTKLSISKAWDESRAVIGRDLSLLATVALALLVLPGVVGDLFLPPMTPGALPEPGSWMIIFVIAILIGLVGQLAIIHMVIADRVSVGEAIGHGLRRAPYYFAATILWTLPFGFVVVPLAQSGNKGAVGLAALVLFPVFVFAFVRMIMTSPVASAEDGGPLHILKRSWTLTHGNWWRLFGFFCLLIVAALVTVIALGAIFAILIALVFDDPKPMTIGALISALLTQMVGAAITVVFVTMLARIYVQLSGEGATVPTSGT